MANAFQGDAFQSNAFESGGGGGTTQEGSFAAASILLRSISGSPSANAVLLKSIPGSTNVDAMFSNGHFTVDAYVPPPSGAFTAQAWLAGIFPVDAIRKTTAEPHVTQILADGPAFYLRLEELAGSFTDSSSFSRTVTTTGSPTRGVPSPRGYGITESGSQYLTVNYTPTNLYAASVEVWFKTTATGYYRFNQGRNSGGRTLQLGIGPAGFGSSAGQLLAYIDSDGIWVGVHTSAAYNDGQWHHVVGTWARASGTVTTSDFKIYVDGSLVSVVGELYASTGVPLTGNGNMTLLDNGYIGSADEIVFYEKELSAERVAAHYVSLIAKSLLLKTFEKVGGDGLKVEAEIVPRRFWASAVIKKTITKEAENGLKVDYRWGPGGTITFNATIKASMSSGEGPDAARYRYGYVYCSSDAWYNPNRDYIVDNNDSTYHRHYDNNPVGDWLYIDFQVPIRIVGIRLVQGGGAGWASSVDIQYSNDAGSWTTAWSASGLISGTNVLSAPANLPPGALARYWRVYCSAQGSTGDWLIYTLEMYKAWVIPFQAHAMISNGHFTVDAYFWPGDANLLLSSSGMEVVRVHDPIVAQMSAAGIEVMYEVPKGTFTTDARLAIITHPEASATIDARIMPRFSVDAYFWTGNAGVHLSAVGAEQVRVPLVQSAQFTGAGLEVVRVSSVNAWASSAGLEVIYEIPKGTFTANCDIYRPGDAMTPASFRIDAFKVFTIRVNAAIIGQGSGSFSAGAIAVIRHEGSFKAEAEKCLGFWIYGIKHRRQTAIFTLFAYKVALSAKGGSFTIDAFRSRSMSVAAWLVATRTATFGASASIIIANKPIRSFYADAVIWSSSRTSDFLIEAEIHATRTVVFEGTGASRVTRTYVTERLHFPGTPNDGQGNLGLDDANNVSGAFFPVDTYPVTVTINDFPAYDGSRTVGVHSENENMWDSPEVPGETFTFWPSYSFEPHYVYTWKVNTTYDPTLIGGGVLTYWSDLTYIDAYAAPTIDAWLVGTLGDPFLVEAEIVGREKTGSFAVAADRAGANERRGTFVLDAQRMSHAAGFFALFAYRADRGFMVDALVRRPSFTADAWIYPHGSFTISATFRKTMSWYPLGPAVDAWIADHPTRLSAIAVNAEFVTATDKRGLFTVSALVLGPRINPRRIYVAAMVGPAHGVMATSAFVAPYFRLGSWVATAAGGLGGFSVGAYVRGDSYTIFSEDGSVPTTPQGGAPVINRRFRVKIEVGIPDPIPVGNNAEIERLTEQLLEAEDELESLYCAVAHYSSQGATSARTVAHHSNPTGTGYNKGTLPKAISQVGYPGAGDVDDCWVVATVWAAKAAGETFQPTVSQFRAWAQNPDRPGPTGGTLDHIMRGARAAWPDHTIRRYRSTDWDGFISLLKAGWTASLAVRSSALPTNLRFGFLGLHQIGVAYQDGQYWVMNPLQSNGADPIAISGADLRRAARGFIGGTICAAMFA